jgi:predicted GNAT family acetyltransferase
MHVLDNPAWEALTTCQAHLAIGGDLAKRYPETVTPIAAIRHRDRTALEQLVDLIPLGDWLSLPATLEGLVPLVPQRLHVTLAKELIQMVREHRVAAPTGGFEFRVLSEVDIPDMMALTEVTRPGPFRSHTYTLGTYLGVRVDGRLAAMGGQRMHVPGYREISAVCVHPDFQGRALGRAIVERLVTMVFDEGLIPFLHVEASNAPAVSLYPRLGFVERRRLPLVVLQHADVSSP